jgi:hypothetical protein
MSAPRGLLLAGVPALASEAAMIDFNLQVQPSVLEIFARVE